MPVPSSINDLSTTAASNSPSGNEAPTTADDYIRAHASFIATLRDGKVDKAGTVTPTANQPMGGYKHTGAGTAVAAGEYVVWNQTGVKFPAMGIGVASSSWSGTGVYAIDIAARGAFAGYASGAIVGANTYYDGTNYRAKETAGGSLLVLSTGLTFNTLASVSAGATQTLVSRLEVSSAGAVSIPEGTFSVASTTAGAVFTVVGQNSTETTNVKIGTVAQDNPNLAYYDQNWDTGAGRHEFRISTTAVAAMHDNGSALRWMEILAPSTAPAISANGFVAFQAVSNTQLKILMRGSDGTVRSTTLTIS